MLNVRSYSWGQKNLSWAFLLEDLLLAFEKLGHNVYVISTNGFDNGVFGKKERLLKTITDLQQFGPGKQAIDLDLTYTIPLNFFQRFLVNSKNKCVIYNYETTHSPENWKKFYHIPDYFFPSSNFSAEIFYKNGVPIEKIFVVPHGVDLTKFNPTIRPIKLKTQKKFKFCSVCTPHARKRLDILLHAYCKAFTKKDDVCLVLKTKIYRHSDGMYDITKNPNGRKQFEIVLGDVFKELIHKYGNNLPEIEIISGYVENVASIYNACHCHISTTGAEGFGLPFIESSASNLINILPRYSGQLDFMNDDNSLLINTKTRYAKFQEQYWHYSPKSIIGEPSLDHTAELMKRVVKEYDELLNKFKPGMNEVVKKYQWKNIAQLIIDICDKKIPNYIPGTYKFPE